MIEGKVPFLRSVYRLSGYFTGRDNRRIGWNNNGGKLQLFGYSTKIQLTLTKIQLT